AAENNGNINFLKMMPELVVQCCFDPETGATLNGNLTLRGGAASQPIVVNDTLYVVSADGRLHAYR
ncbi:MAG: PQQ-binding-like beta-propeller repeat protein, partial [Paracoccaceae bacterium]